MEGDVFDPVRERIRAGKGRLRKMGSDYLAYALIDAIVDNYFIVLEKMGEDIEELEKKLISNPKPQTLQKHQPAEGRTAIFTEIGMASERVDQWTAER